MKKFLSLILAMAMIMSTLVVLTIMPAVAAQVDGTQVDKTYKLDASNWLDSDEFMLGYNTVAFNAGIFNMQMDKIAQTSYNGSVLKAGSETAYFLNSEGKLTAYVKGNATSADLKPVIVFTAPEYGYYSYEISFTTDGGSPEMNSFRKGGVYDECKATKDNPNASLTVQGTEETEILLEAGKNVIFTIHDNYNASCEVSFEITVTYRKADGKVFNFKSVGTDDHGEGFSIYGVANAEFANLEKLTIKTNVSGETVKTTIWGSTENGTSNGYFGGTQDEPKWTYYAYQGDYNSLSFTRNTAIGFVAPADGVYSVKFTLGDWTMVPADLYVDDKLVGTVAAPSGVDVAVQSAGITLEKGQTLYAYFKIPNWNGENVWSGAHVKTYSVTYVGAESTIGYAASLLPADPFEVAYNSNFDVVLNVNKSADATITGFASAEFKLTYDKTYFDYVDTGLEYKIVEGENNINTLIIEDYGETKAFGDAYTISFKGKVATEDADPATVSINLTEAAFSRAVDAEKSDLVAATLGNTEVKVQINKQRFDVTLDPVDHFSTSGEAIIGESFTITEKNAANYNYNNVVITMNGVTLTEDDYTYSNNQYVIAEVTGAITVTATVTEKVYDVTINGDTESNDGPTATYNTDYSFTIPENVAVGDTTDGYTYTVYNLTIGGTAIIVDGEVQDGMAGRYSVAERTYTIGGSYITGAIAIEVKEEVTAANSVTVSYEGQTGAISTKPVQAVKNTAFSVTLDNPTPGYTYTVTYSVGGTDKGELTAANGVYTIPAGDVTAPIVINVSAAIKTNVSVEEYLTLNGATMYIVYNTVDELTNDTNYAIWGSTISGVKEMFWSDKYDAYCYLVVVEGEAPVASDFSLKIVNGAATAVHATEETDTVKYDVNLTGKVDINDAQLVYNMYETKAYTEFSANVTVEKFLRADINETVGITVEDASAIVTYILG